MCRLFSLNSLSALYKHPRNKRWIACIADRINHQHNPGSIYMRLSCMQAGGGGHSILNDGIPTLGGFQLLEHQMLKRLNVVEGRCL